MLALGDEGIIVLICLSLIYNNNKYEIKYRCMSITNNKLKLLDIENRYVSKLDHL